MRILTTLMAALLFLAACSSDGNTSVDAGADSTTTPTAADEPTPEPTALPEPTSDGGGDAAAEPTAAPVDDATPTPLAAPTAEPTVEPEPEPLYIILPAVRYCYAGDDDINEMYVRMTVLDSGDVSGDTRIFISDEDNGYFTSAFQRFSGMFNPDGSLTAELTTWIEYDIQSSTESWAVLPSGLQTDVATIEETSCELVREAYVDIFVPNTDIGVTADEVLDRTFLIDERISFEAGASSATVSNAVVRGDADRYALDASGGQVMTISITSLEDNAIFDLVSDSGILLAIEATAEEILDRKSVV